MGGPERKRTTGKACTSSSGVGLERMSKETMLGDTGRSCYSRNGSVQAD